MPTKYTSPFATSFKSACKRGTSYNVAVQNIAKRCKKSPTVVWESLFKAGLCYRQKFNGQWIYFPCEVKKATATTCKNSQWECWQWFCEWSLLNGFCTPEQMKKNCGTQTTFMTWCRKFFSKQFTTGTTKKRTTKSRSLKFPTAKSRTTRRYRRAA
ncbi:MAG: hypothetical protein KJO43_10000 [Phycisphaerae bacterium]|nr:hypothetical protein [Phycisphaerae bacterium]NNF43594.1 hypothetical protein [Phycisphaerales bacterium]